MMRAMRRPLSLLVAIACWSPLGAVAYADEQVTPPLAPLDDEGTARAEAQFRGAVEAFAAGRYHAAIALFTEADRIRPKPELSFDIARSYENLGDYATAVAFYREYLRRAGHPADEAEVLARIDQLSSRNSSPASLPESNDDGPRMIAAQTASGPFAGNNGVNAPTRDAEANGSGKVFTTLGWAGLGAAAVAFGGAAAFEVMRHGAENDAANERQQIRFDQYVQTMETDRTAARVLFGTGAVLTLTGGIFLFVGASKSRAQDKKPLVALRVAPEAGGLSAGAAWRF